MTLATLANRKNKFSFIDHHRRNAEKPVWNGKIRMNRQHEPMQHAIMAMGHNISCIMTYHVSRKDDGRLVMWLQLEIRKESFDNSKRMHILTTTLEEWHINELTQKFNNMFDRVYNMRIKRFNMERLLD